MKNSRKLQEQVRALSLLVSGIVTSSPSLADIIVSRNITSLPDPSGYTGTGTLDSVMQAAAAYYNDIFDGAIDLDLTYGWGSFTELANTSVLGSGTRFSSSANWFLDGTPYRNEEFAYQAPDVGDFGGGLMTTGRAMTSISPELSGRYDLFSVALHEIGHELGFKGLSNPYSVTSGPFTGASFPIDAVLGEGSHFSNSDPALWNAVMMSRPAVGGRYLPSAADISVLAEQQGGAAGRSWDFESIYAAGNVSISNAAETPIGDGVFNPGLLTIDGPFSGIAITDLPKTGFLGTVEVTDRGSFDIVNSAMTVLNGAAFSGNSRLRLTGASLQFKTLDADATQITLTDSAIYTQPPPLFGTQPVINISNSNLTFEGTSHIDAGDVALRINNTNIKGNADIRGTDIVIDGAASILDPGFSPGTMLFTGSVEMLAGTIKLEHLNSGIDQVLLSGSFLIGEDVRIELFVDSSIPFEIDLSSFFPGALPIFEVGFEDWHGLSLFTDEQTLAGTSFGITYGSMRKDLVVQVVPLPKAAWLFGSGLLTLIGISRVRRKETAYCSHLFRLVSAPA